MQDIQIKDEDIESGEMLQDFNVQMVIKINGREVIIEDFSAFGDFDYVAAAIELCQQNRDNDNQLRIQYTNL